MRPEPSIFHTAIVERRTFSLQRREIKQKNFQVVWCKIGIAIIFKRSTGTCFGTHSLGTVGRNQQLG
ncbi:hypothetical protein DUNSADRAFT_9278 [Dunaliella salina]|uniref:Uncharacterized protein n=1 Tax=Dunaliella salina TaxID=3046 RepID=A0ABQ7GHR8_DUNSA|nr:hypothetical protein DUNSADRAFT_9278 [Dunaliella salina]|eukprot:KAF5834159.1 hypothetical protein DUNSADRAFT_9278 [Dunaliella salina]